jgi:ankyrin repeat protein
MISEGSLDVNHINKEGMDPLMLAVDCEFSLETMEFLINKGCSVHNKDGQGRTALHYAIDLENEEIARFLIENGADINAQDDNGSSPLDEA